MGEDPKKAVVGAAMGTIVVVTVLGLAAWRLLAPAAHAGRCDLSSQICPVSLGGRQLEIELIPRRPKPGEELRLILGPASAISSELGAAEVRVDFSMPGMDMGEHVMRMELHQDDILEGQIALPTCPMGHSLWLASVRIGQGPVTELVLHVGE